MTWGVIPSPGTCTAATVCAVSAILFMLAPALTKIACLFVHELGIHPLVWTLDVAMEMSQDTNVMSEGGSPSILTCVHAQTNTHPLKHAGTV